MQSRGWHGSEFSNLSRPTPTNFNLFRPNPTKKLGENPVPFHTRKNDSHSLPLPCRFFFFFAEICQLQYKYSTDHSVPTLLVE